MVLSDEQKKALLERLQKGKEKKAQEKAQLEKEQIKKEDVKEVEVKKPFKEINEDIKPPIEDINKNSVSIDEAFSTLPKKEKVEKLEKKTKEKPYLKIKLYKEPTNPDLINNLVQTLNGETNQSKSKTEKEQKATESVELNSIKNPVQNVQNRYIEEREKKLKDLCRLYFN